MDLPFDKILTSIIVDSNIISPFSSYTALLIVSVYVNWGFRPVKLIDVLLNGTCIVDCLYTTRKVDCVD